MERYYEFISMNPYLVGWFPTKISQILIISPNFLNLQGKRDLWKHLTSKKSPCWSNCIFTNKNLTPKNQAADQASPSGFSRSWSWKVAVRFAISPRKNTCQEKAIQLSSNKMVLQKNVTTLNIMMFKTDAGLHFLAESYKVFWLKCWMYDHCIAYRVSKYQNYLDTTSIYHLRNAWTSIPNN